jgi:hypothetical protein
MVKERIVATQLGERVYILMATPLRRTVICQWDDRKEVGICKVQQSTGLSHE